MYQLKLHYMVSAFLTPLAYLAILCVLVVAIRRGIRPPAVLVLAAGYMMSLVNHTIAMLAYISASQVPHPFRITPAVISLQMIADWGGIVLEVAGWAMLLPWLVSRRVGQNQASQVTARSARRT